MVMFLIHACTGHSFLHNAVAEFAANKEEYPILVHELLLVLGSTCDPVVGGFLGVDCPLEVALEPGKGSSSKPATQSVPMSIHSSWSTMLSSLGESLPYSLACVDLYL